MSDATTNEQTEVNNHSDYHNTPIVDSLRLTDEQLLERFKRAMTEEVLLKRIKSHNQLFGDDVSSEELRSYNTFEDYKWYYNDIVLDHLENCEQIYNMFNEFGEMPEFTHLVEFFKKAVPMIKDEVYP